MLSMSTCNEDDNGGSSAFLGKTLKLSEQVWTVSYSDTGYTWEKFTGTATVSAFYYDSDTEESKSLGGSGTITNGQLSFEIETPTNHSSSSPSSSLAFLPAPASSGALAAGTGFDLALVCFALIL